MRDWKKPFVQVTILLIACYIIFASIFADLNRRNNYSSNNTSNLLPSGLIGYVSEENLRFSEKNQHDIIEPLIEHLGQKILQKMRLAAICQLAGECPLRVLVYECGHASLSCGGLADRLRGLVSLFYAAYASDRVLVINWRVPENFGLFFEINEEMYGISLGERRESQALMAALLKDKTVDTHHFYYNLGDASALIAQQPVISYTTVSLDLLMQTFERPVLRHRISELTSLITSYTKSPTVSYEMATFLALRILLRRPKPLLIQTVDALTKELAKFKCRIGVHVRSSPKNIFQRYVEWPRLTQNQLKTCFFNEIVNATKDVGCHGNVAVYIASDSLEAKRWLIDNLAQKAGITAIGSQFKVLHIDNDMTNQSASLRHEAMLETIADWLVLTTANRLVITRSGFGEMASTYGFFMAYRKAPTHRLPLGYAENCLFENDYHITTGHIDGFKPPPGRTYTMPEKYQI